MATVDARSFTSEDAEALLKLAEWAEEAQFSPEAAAASDAIKGRADDFESATDVFLRSGDTGAALRIVAALRSFWEDEGLLGRGAELTEKVLAAAPEQTDARARALLAASELAFRRGDQVTARRRAEEAIAIAQARGEARINGLAHVSLARIAFRDGDAEAIERLSRLALDATPDDPIVRRGAIHMLAWAAHTRGDLAGAIERFTESLAVRREMGGPLGIAAELGNLADLALEQGDTTTAAMRLHEALQLATSIRSTYLLLANLVSAAQLAARLGNHRDAVPLLAAARAGYDRAGLLPDPGTDDLVADILNSARKTLGSEVDALSTAGGRLTLDEAVAAATALVTNYQDDPF